jgi:hypothetical protein
MLAFWSLTWAARLILRSTPVQGAAPPVVAQRQIYND